MFFLKRTRNPESAADLTAEVFAAALDHVGEFVQKGGLRWRGSTALRTTVGRQPSPRPSGRPSPQTLGAEPDVVIDEALERVEGLADAQRTAGILRQLLEQLPPEQHDVIRARVIEERSYPEIANDLSVFRGRDDRRRDGPFAR